MLPPDPRLPTQQAACPARRVMPHQMDEMRGRMYFDHPSRVTRDMLMRRARKAR